MHTAKEKPKQSNRRSGIKSADKMYSVLAAMGPGWHDRRAIVSTMGKARLNVSESAALQYLAEAGRIELRTVDATDFIRRLEYCVIVPSDAGE